MAMAKVENLSIADEFPSDAMLAFMLMHIPRFCDFEPPLYQNLEQVIFGMVQVESARMRVEVGLVSPPSSPRQTEARRAPPAPIRPPRPALALAPGQPLPTTVRELFAGVPDGVPDA